MLSSKLIRFNPAHSIMFDKGGTTFDLQDTTFNDCTNIFRVIRNSNREYTTIEELTNSDLKESMQEHYTLGPNDLI